MTDARRLRAWCFHRHGLDGGLAESTPAAVLSRTGWARSVGGAGPYLGIFARAGVDREAVDAAVHAVEICELPAARGCTYVVPADDFALALAASTGFSADAEMKVARKLGVTEREIEALEAGVTKALGRAAKTPDEIRELVGDLARNLGEAGKKAGLSTTLPVALGRLQQRGAIRRVPTNGRLDQQRYRYAAWRPSPMPKRPLATDALHREFASRYWAWTGLATLEEFRWFFGLGVKAARVAVEALGLVPLAEGDPRLLAPADLDALRSFRPPKKPDYALVSALDGMFQLRRNVRDALADEDQRRVVLAGKGRDALGNLSDLPHHAILDRGRLVGLWDYDPEAAAIVWTAFVPATAALRRAIETTETFVRDQLGDARAFSLDSPASRAARLASLRAPPV